MLGQGKYQCFSLIHFLFINPLNYKYLYHLDCDCNGLRKYKLKKINYKNTE